MSDESVLTEEMFSVIDSMQTFASGMINEFRANFDKYTYDEQILFTDIVHDLEECIINCEMYKLYFAKKFKKDVQLDTYRVVEGDTLISIANKYYGDPTKWKDIYLANYLVDFDLSDVDTLVIPQLNEVEDE
jgi:hypothetical protein